MSVFDIFKGKKRPPDALTGMEQAGIIQIEGHRCKRLALWVI